MNATELTPQQLRRAASIKERIDGLTKELRHILEVLTTNGARNKRMMTAAVKKKIAAAQRARWAKLRRV